MSEKDLAKFLKEFKKEEPGNIHSITMLIEQRDAQKVTTSWTTIPLSWSSPRSKPPKESNLLWDWLWAGVKYDPRLLSDRTGIPLGRIGKVFEPLRANRILYPDGTVADFAVNFLRAEVMKLLPSSVKKG